MYWKEEHYKWKVLYLAKLTYSKGEIKTFSDKQKLGKLITTTPTIQKKKQKRKQKNARNSFRLTWKNTRQQLKAVKI